jgi:competence protein ComEC
MRSAKVQHESSRGIENTGGRRCAWLNALVLLLFLSGSVSGAAKPLLVYFIDVEGGQATLFVSPSGESMLVDTGWAGHQGRDARRIVAAARDAGLRHIDFLVITHYHADHVGGVPQLVALMPVRNFIDHGTPVQTDALTRTLVRAYTHARGHAHHTVARPGMRIPIRGIQVAVLAAAGAHIEDSLPGGGGHNRFCPAQPGAVIDRSENAQSIGLLVNYGAFRMIDLGDLPSWPGEFNLVCPINRIAEVSVYLTTQHAYAESGASFLVDALHPIVAIGDNGAHKGGAPEAFQVIQQSPGIEGFWDLHYSDAASKALNARPPYIANLTDHPDHGYWLKLAALPSGSFTVTNQRNGVSRTYHPR